jgi:acetyl-CoA carboxylase biotin carboxyl carrier protein
MDLRKIKKLIEMMEDSSLTELEIQEGEENIRLSRQPAASAAPAYYPPYPPPPGYAPPPAAAPPAAGSADAGKDKVYDGHVVKSPMVGTFYRSPSPTSKVFIEEGQSVKEGDTLCIIEAMKILNQIVADKGGRVSKILAQNGDPVEYGQPLFVIE